MILFAPFVICRMWPSTQGTFCWGITGFSTCSTVVVSSAFDTVACLITIFTRVPVLLAPYALLYVWFGGTRGFCMNDFVLDGLYSVDVFVVFGWFEGYEEYV